MNKTLAERIKNLIEENGVTQKELANKINVTEATLSRNLNGIHEPKAEIINKIAEYFNVSSDYLLGLIDDRHQSSSNTSDVNLAFYNQHGIVTDEQKKEVEAFIEFIKSKK